MLQAISNGVQSREVIFNIQGEIAPILNLVVTLTNGYISGLNWSNSCYDNQVCETNQCKPLTITSDLNPVTEYNCMLFGCTAAQSQCDTQVYVTWVGKDRDNRTCVSDNFRISGFTDFGVKSYYDAALGLPSTTYYQVV